MKKRSSIFLALAIILMTSIACTIGGTALSTEVEKEPTPGSEQTNPVATTVPSQEAGGNDPSAGPETIDLTNPALYIVPNAPAFKFESTIKYTGVDTTGVAKEVSEIGLVEVQTQPQTTQRFLSSLEGYMDSPGTKGSINILSSDTVIIGDQMTSAQMVSAEGGTPKLFCNTTLVSEIQGPGMLESMFKLQDMITGQATRVESGIEVNGYVTDKYSLSGDNLRGGMGRPAHLCMWLVTAVLLRALNCNSRRMRIDLDLIPTNLQTPALNTTITLWRMARLILSFLLNATSRSGG